jgi:hypothetical protein
MQISKERSLSHMVMKVVQTIRAYFSRYGFDSFLFFKNKGLFAFLLSIYYRFIIYGNERVSPFLLPFFLLKIQGGSICYSAKISWD